MIRLLPSPLLSLLLLALLSSACATVRPYERSALQSRVMQPPTTLQVAADGHVDGTREAMRGALAGGGTSCGCN